MRRLNWFLDVYRMPDLRVYVSENTLVEEVSTAVLTGKLSEVIAAPLGQYGAQPAPPICTWCTDLATIRRPASFTIGGVTPATRGVRFFGLVSQVLERGSHGHAQCHQSPRPYAPRAAFLFNVGHGPWQSKIFWRDLCGTLKQLAMT